MSRIINNCQDDEISFWNDSNGDGISDNTDAFYNPKSPLDKTCHVFNPAGGGVNYSEINPAYLDGDTTHPGYGKYMFSGNNQVTNIGTTCDAASCSELMFYVNGNKVNKPRITITLNT